MVKNLKIVEKPIKGSKIAEVQVSFEHEGEDLFKIYRFNQEVLNNTSFDLQEYISKDIEVAMAPRPASFEDFVQEQMAKLKMDREIEELRREIEAAKKEVEDADTTNS